jgi:hypothetical protein
MKEEGIKETLCGTLDQLETGFHAMIKTGALCFSKNID